MFKLIKLSENDVAQITEDIAKLITEKKIGTFDSSMFDGVDDVDLPTIRMYIRSLIGNLKSQKTPYAPIQRLVSIIRYNGTKSTGLKDVISAPKIMNLLKDSNPIIEKAMDDIVIKHNKLMEVVDGSSRINGSKTELVDNVYYLIDDILSDVQTLMTAISKSDVYRHYETAPIFAGTADGRQLGFGNVLLKCNMNLLKIGNEIKKLQQIVSSSEGSKNYYEKY